MITRDIFQEPIDRPIEDVIKVNQINEAVVVSYRSTYSPSPAQVIISNEIFWTAFKVLPKAEQQAVLRRLVQDQNLRRDLMDLSLIEERRDEPPRPPREYLKKSQNCTACFKARPSPSAPFVWPCSLTRKTTRPHSTSFTKKPSRILRAFFRYYTFCTGQLHIEQFEVVIPNGVRNPCRPGWKLALAGTSETQPTGMPRCPSLVPSLHSGGVSLGVLRDREQMCLCLCEKFANQVWDRDQAKIHLTFKVLPI